MMGNIKFGIMRGVILAAFIVPLSAQVEQSDNGVAELLYFESTALFHAYVILPANYDSTRIYPLVIGLHGGGGSADKFKSIWQETGQKEFIFVVPQAPYAWQLGAEMRYEWSLWPTANTTWIARAAALADGYIGDLTQLLRSRYAVDDVYLLGFSQGAILTYIIGINNPHRFNGLIILSGPGLLEPLASPWTGEMDLDWLSEQSISAGSDLRMFIAHGTADEDANYGLAVKSRDLLLRYGYDLTFRAFDGGHSLNQAILEEVSHWITQEGK